MAYFSNGSEGADYEEFYCSRCVHSDLAPDKEIGDADNPACPIWMAHLFFAYEECNATSNAKTMLDMLIPMKTIEDAGDGHPMTVADQCRMFVPRDEGAIIPGQLSIETP